MSQNLVTGTPSQFADRLTINGVKVSQPAFSILASLFLDQGFRKVGTIRSEGARRSATVWEVDLSKFPNATMGTASAEASEASEPLGNQLIAA